MCRLDTVAAANRLQSAFSEILTEPSDIGGGGAAVALWQNDSCILSLYGGDSSPGNPWRAHTPSLIWSASKGIAAACILHSLQEKGVSLETPVSTLWSEFAASGKKQITLAELLSHRAGLAAIDQRGLSLSDHSSVVAALAAQPPNWKLDTNGASRHGYGARTFGFLLDEIIRRVAGEPLSSYWNSAFREPLALDLWFGLPEAQLSLAATIIAPKAPPQPSDFSRAFANPASLTRRALSEPGGLLSPSIMNTPAMRMASIPSLGVIATADSLARFYAILAGSNVFFTQKTLSNMQETLSRGLDLTLLEETSFSAGFMTNEMGVYGPGRRCFGHPGAGGSLAFADPQHGFGFAFIPSAMHPGALPGRRTRKLVQALYGINQEA